MPEVFWAACEMHTHTMHSDGSFTTAALCEAAVREGYDLIALTDHNTRAPLLDLEKFEPPLPVMPGIEWTGFYGHLLVLGGDSGADWRDAAPWNIRDKLAAIAGSGCLAGIAHPFAPGNPICTGCHWDYGLEDYSNISYVEVWNGDFPPKDLHNRVAVSWHRSLLDEGWRLPLTAGRDWHGPVSPDAPGAYTCLGIAGELSVENAFEALNAGRSSVTMGPLLTMEIDSAGPGKTAGAGRKIVEVGIDTGWKREYWKHRRVTADTVRIIGPRGAVPFLSPVRERGRFTAELDLAPGWIQAELEGTVLGQPCTVALTSPIYLE